jgi:hypothetical protein
MGYCNPREEIERNFCKTKVVKRVWQDFLREGGPADPPENNPDGRISRKTEIADGVVTVTDEVIEEGGEPHYSCEVSMGSEPIESHFRYSNEFNQEWQQAELIKWKTWKSNPNDPSLASTTTNDVYWTPFKSTSWAVVEWGEFFTKGITDYLEPKVTLKFTKFEKTPPEISNIGLIGNPGSIFEVGTKTWLFIGANGQQETVPAEGIAGWWKNTYEYLLSGRNGWNVKLYGSE